MSFKISINLFLDGNSNIGLDLTQSLQQKLRLIWRLGNFLWFVDPKVVLLTKLKEKQSHADQICIINLTHMEHRKSNHINMMLISCVAAWENHSHGQTYRKHHYCQILLFFFTSSHWKMYYHWLSTPSISVPVSLLTPFKLKPYCHLSSQMVEHPCWYHWLIQSVLFADYISCY